MPMHESHDWRMVVFSVLIAMVASYATLDLAGRVTAARGRVRVYWLGGGAASMGMGVWAMHYIGMLAYSLPVKALYDLPTVLASLLAAVAASLIALFTASREHLKRRQTAVASLFMGCGIASMHYIGMAAMRLPARAQYSPVIVGASIAIAVVISYVALVLSVGVREEMRTSWRKIISTLVMGSAIPVMHYTGMWAVTFVPSSDAMDLSHAVDISSLGVWAICSVSVLVLLLAIGTSFLDRLATAQRALLDVARRQEVYFRSLAEAIPQIVWTARSDGYPDFFNQRWYDYTRRELNQSVGHGWEAALHPEDVAATLAAWDAAVQHGTTYEVQYRFLRAQDQTYHWFLGRAQPVRDERGMIVKWFGTCTDIDEQKRNQETLEGQVRQRTEALVEANQQLVQQMAEREWAQEKTNLGTAKLVQELTERSRTAALLARLGELLQSGPNLQEAFSIITGFAPKIFPAWRGAIILLNGERTLLEVAGEWSNCQMSSMFFEPNSCWALRTGRRHRVEEGDRSVPCEHAVAAGGGYLCVPVQAQGETIGIVHLQIPHGAPAMVESELALVTTFAEQVALSIANIRLREELRNQSIRDPLTGLFNRRYLEETMNREIHRVKRSKQSLGVLMLDLDHFKRFNDTFGHDAGDAVLREVALLFSRRIRTEDIACRYGGEEFVLVLPDASLEMTVQRAEDLCAESRQLKIVHNGKPLPRVTISIGAASYPASGIGTQALLSAADAALYQAKESGRDRVVVAQVRVSAEEIGAAVHVSG